MQLAFVGSIPSALLQLKQMIDGAQSELDLLRSHASGTLSASAKVIKQSSTITHLPSPWSMQGKFWRLLAA